MEQILGRQRVGHVERKIATPTVGFEKREVVVIADEIAVGGGRTHLLQNPLFAGFKDTGRGDPDCGIFNFRFSIFVFRKLEFAEAGDGIAVVFRVFELAINRAGPGGPGGVELFKQADDGDELRGGSVGGVWSGNREVFVISS